MYPGLVSCPFYAIPIYPFKFMKFFIYLYIYKLFNINDIHAYVGNGTDDNNNNIIM